MRQRIACPVVTGTCDGRPPSKQGLSETESRPLCGPAFFCTVASIMRHPAARSNQKASFLGTNDQLDSVPKNRPRCPRPLGDDSTPSLAKADGFRQTARRAFLGAARYPRAQPGSGRRLGALVAMPGEWGISVVIFARRIAGGPGVKLDPAESGCLVCQCAFAGPHSVGLAGTANAQQGH